MKVLSSLNFIVYNDKTNTVKYKYTAKRSIVKTSYTVEEQGKYRVCASRAKTKAFSGKKIFIKMSVESESSGGKNLDNALKNKDLNPVVEKIDQIISKSKSIIESQKMETDIEDAFSTMQMSYTWNFVVFACVQILGVIAIGIYHIYSFRKFLQNNNILE